MTRLMMSSNTPPQAWDEVETCQACVEEANVAVKEGSWLGHQQVESE